MAGNPTKHRSDDARMTERPGRGRRRVALFAALFVVISGALYAAAPQLLPPRIVEGPLVQQAGQNTARLVWFMSRPLGHEVAVTVEGARAVVTSAGRRCVAEIEGLKAGSEHSYVISSRGVELGRATLATEKPRGSAFRFLVFGDSGEGTREQYRLAARMTAERPDLVVHSGDLVYSGGQRRNYAARFFEPYREMLARVAFWPSLGNHDVADPAAGASYREVFELPSNGPPGLPTEHAYWFDYADARFVVLDSNAMEFELRDSVGPWMARVFAECDHPWRFVVFHHPPYTAGSHQPNEKIQQALVPVIEAAGVDMVFNGHDHLYERTAPLRGGKPSADGGGVIYIVTGAGGAELYEAAAARPEQIVSLSNARHSYTRVDIHAGTLTLEQIDIEGATLDSLKLVKPGAGG